MKITRVFGPTPSGTYFITDEQGEQYATKNQLRASVAQRAMETGKDVAIQSFPGFYRELREISIVDAKESCA